MTQNINKELEEILTAIRTKGFNDAGAYSTLPSLWIGKELDIDEALAKIQALITLKQKEARIDELNRLDTRRHYGKDYQESLDELDEYKDARLLELENERSKIEGVAQ